MTLSSAGADASVVADAIPHIVWTHNKDGVAQYFNRRWTEYTGLDLAETLRVGAESLVHPDDREGVVRVFGEARSSGKAAEAWYRLRRRDGAYRWHRASIVPLVEGADGVAAWIGTATDADAERQLWNEQHYLAAASRVLGTSLDLAQTLKDVAALVVPHLADWCAIDLLKGDGGIERAAVAHVDPEKVALAWHLAEILPPKPDDPSGVYKVIRTREPDHLEEIPDALLEQSLPTPELLATFRGLGLRSSMCVPLIARDAVLGALTLVGAESGRIFAKRDLAFAQDFAQRIAVAVDNARLYTEATQARAAAEALAADVIEQSQGVEAALLEMRRERDEALAQLAARK